MAEHPGTYSVTINVNVAEGVSSATGHVQFSHAAGPKHPDKVYYLVGEDFTVATDLVARIAEDVAGGEGIAGAVHRYLSTACLHGEHTYCKSNIGAVGAKKPAACKFCNAPCMCADCGHTAVPNGTV